MSELRRIVERAIDELLRDARGSRDGIHRARQHQILTRCDLHGESHKSVATDLGISLRHFYRERRKARLQIAEYVAQEIARHEHQPARTFDAFGLALNRAQLLFELGIVDTSVAQLRDVTRTCHDDRNRALAHSALIEIFARCGDSEDAKAELERTRMLLGATFAPWIDSMEGTVLWYAGLEADADRIDRRNRKTLDQLASSADHLAREFALGQYLELAIRSGWKEDQRRTDPLLERAQELIASIEHVPPALHASFLCELANSQVVQCGPAEHTMLLIRNALEMAERHGLHERYALCLFTLSIFEEANGDIERALETARGSMRTLPFVATLDVRHSLSLRTADLEARIGNPTLGADLAGSVRNDVLCGSHLWLYASLFEGKALLSMRDFERAVPLLLGTYDRAKESPLAVGNRASGTAMHLLADSYVELGRMKEASACIEESIRLLENCGYPVPLARAHQTAARIHGRFMPHPVAP